MVCCVAEDDWNEMALVVAFPNVYVIFAVVLKARATFPAPAVASPMVSVIAAV
jgi:hypothetical protein